MRPCRVEWPSNLGSATLTTYNPFAFWCFHECSNFHNFFEVRNEMRPDRVKRTPDSDSATPKTYRNVYLVWWTRLFSCSCVIGWVRIWDKLPKVIRYNRVGDTKTNIDSFYNKFYSSYTKEMAIILKPSLPYSPYITYVFLPFWKSIFNSFQFFKMLQKWYKNGHLKKQTVQNWYLFVLITNIHVSFSI